MVTSVLQHNFVGGGACISCSGSVHSAYYSKMDRPGDGLLIGHHEYVLHNFKSFCLGVGEDVVE